MCLADQISTSHASASRSSSMAASGTRVRDVDVFQNQTCNSGPRRLTRTGVVTIELGARCGPSGTAWCAYGSMKSETHDGSAACAGSSEVADSSVHSQPECSLPECSLPMFTPKTLALRFVINCTFRSAICLRSPTRRTWRVGHRKRNMGCRCFHTSWRLSVGAVT